MGMRNLFCYVLQAADLDGTPQKCSGEAQASILPNGERQAFEDKESPTGIGTDTQTGGLHAGKHNLSATSACAMFVCVTGGGSTRQVSARQTD